jgi:P4 family phage/plasmid primase-like protien
MQITDGDLDVEKALQVIFGYTLYGHTKAQLMFIFVGSGANGKGVLLNVLRYVFGKWATAISYTLIRQHTTNPNAASPALAALAGARLIVCSEATKGAPLEEAFIKNITGSDPISCRGNYADQSTFIPQGTLLLATNDFPKVSFDDQALWRRTYPVHFKIQFQGDDCDPGLEDKLKAEASGILNWLIEGAISYHQCGKIPWAAASLQYLEKLKQASDTIGNWLRDCCKRDAGLSAVSSTAFASYKEHAKNQHAKAVNQKEFKEILNQKGYPPKRMKRANMFMGFSIKPLQ